MSAMVESIEGGVAEEERSRIGGSSTRGDVQDEL
jgi:hypothetical protein